LGYDEESLGAMLRPHMKGLKFILNWVVSTFPPLIQYLPLMLSFSQTDEDVLLSFETASSDLESKLTAISSILRNLISDTGFCYSVEPVIHEDGRVIRGSWTPVATSSRGSNGTKPLHNPLKTANAFAAFGGGGGGASSSNAQNQNVWGSLVGVSHNKVSSQPLRSPIAGLADPFLLISR